MAFKMKVIGAKKDDLQCDNSRFIDVHFVIEDAEGEQVAERHLGFPIDATREFIDEALNKYVQTFGLDASQAEASKEREAVEKSADKVIDDLLG